MEPAAECPLCAIPYVDGSQYCRECGQKRPLKQDCTRHETEASHRRSQAEDREVEREQRQVQEQQRKAYIEWQEQQRLKEVHSRTAS
eukprot:g31596.t1